MTNQRTYSNNTKTIQTQHNIEFLSRVLRISKAKAAQIIESKLKPVKRDPIAGAREEKAR
jgi:hypothetical protein